MGVIPLGSPGGGVVLLGQMKLCVDLVRVL